MWARALHSYGALSRRSPRSARSRTATAAAAALTPSDSIRPRSGSAISSIARLRHPRAQPAALAAEHEHHPGAAVVGRVVGDRARRLRASSPRSPRSTSIPRRAPRPRKSAMLRTRATCRCSTAPGRGLAHRRGHLGRAPLGDHHAAAPAHSAVRQIEPRFCGSCTWSSATISGSAPASSSSADDVRIAARPPRRCPGERPSRSGARSPRPSSPAPARPQATARARRPASPRPRPRCCARRPRSASRTALRP